MHCLDLLNKTLLETCNKNPFSKCYLSLGYNASMSHNASILN